MKLSTKGRYGTRAVLDIALHRGEEPVLLKDIAHRQQIPLPYLEHLVTPLISAGIIRSKKGAKGGITLAKSPEVIKLSDIIKALEGPITMAECVDKPETCSRAETCATRDIWSDVTQAIEKVLESVTLQNLVERQQKKKGVKQGMYYI